MQSLVDPANLARHPENWIAGVEHPSLPPQPAMWRHPPQVDPPLSPHQLQLNPFLEHRRFGEPPIQHDLRCFYLEDPQVILGELPPNGDTIVRPRVLCFSMLGPNGAQPATYPGVRSMKITMLADDSLPVFPWPFIVHAHHDALPVTVRDVLIAVTENFKQRLTQEEVDSMSLGRQQLVNYAYWARIHWTRGRTSAVSEEDLINGLRRVDYLGTNYIFRGLEPAPDGEGFTLFVGAP